MGSLHSFIISVLFDLHVSSSKSTLNDVTLETIMEFVKLGKVIIHILF
ncbi:hypothetical protein MKX01_035150, partial [Papaver californicum]